jgi:short-subunit dehydrogenase
MEIAGAHVLITGGSRGIGAELARGFASQGAIVSLVARSSHAIESLAGELGGRAYPTDLLDPQALDGLIPRIEKDSGPVTVMVANAGLESTNFLVDTDIQLIRDLARTNLEVPMVLTRHVLPGMMERNRGHLVYVSSLAGTAGFPGQAAYCATKAGLTNFASAIRMETRDSNVGVTVVAPGPVNTGMWDQLEEADNLAPILKRLKKFRLLPQVEPGLIADKTVSAVQEGRRHVRTPFRLGVQFWLNEAPRRVMETVLAGVQTGPTAPNKRGK